MDQIKPYLRILKRNWWIVMLTTLSAFSIALAISYFSTPIYQTRAQFIVSPGPAFLASINEDLSDAVRGIESLDKRSIITTYEEIMNSRQIVEQAGAALQMTASELDEYEILAVVLPEASSLELTVTGPDAVTASKLANTMGQEGINYIQTLYNQLYNITLLDTAVVPSSPISPQPIRDGMVSLVLGFMIGVALAIVADYAYAPLAAMWQSVTTSNSRVMTDAQTQDAATARSTQI